MKLINQTIETRKSFGYSITEFKLNTHFKLSNLISTKIFDLELKPNDVKETIKKNDYINQNGYLMGLFCSDKLSIKDFKFINIDGIYYYLEGFSDSEEEWGVDKPFFKSLLESFIKKTVDSLNGCYLINKDWFNDKSNKVRNREYIIYDFYFIIIWLDKRDSSKLYVAEWSAD
mgnify:CR=1 FL=1|jgi:hypothetical protein